MRDMTAIESYVADGVVAKLLAHENSTPRTQQSAERKLGVSDMGNCRNRARHFVLQTEFDEGADAELPWSAIVGKAIESYVLDKIVTPTNGHLRDLKVMVTLPSGLQLPGHPDLVMPNMNAVFDIKTVDGLYWPQKDGASLQQLFQRRLYAAGLVQQGVLDGGRTVYCGNIWFDRSGRERDPWVEVEVFEEWMLDEVDQWIEDVNYAVIHNEEASRDKPYEWCRVACEFFSKCRGQEGEAGGIIPDPDGAIDRAAAEYVQAAAAKKQADRAQRAAKDVIAELSGQTAHHVIRSTWVGESTVPETVRRGYWRLTVRERNGDA